MPWEKRMAMLTQWLGLPTANCQASASCICSRMIQKCQKWIKDDEEVKIAREKELKINDQAKAFPVKEKIVQKERDMKRRNEEIKGTVKLKTKTGNKTCQCFDFHLCLIWRFRFYKNHATDAIKLRTSNELSFWRPGEARKHMWQIIKGEFQWQAQNQSYNSRIEQDSGNCIARERWLSCVSWCGWSWYLASYGALCSSKRSLQNIKIVHLTLQCLID